MAGATKNDRKANVNLVVKTFKDMTNNPSTLPSVMPMSAAIAPRFTKRYTEAAIIFDTMGRQFMDLSSWTMFVLGSEYSKELA